MVVSIAMYVYQRVDPIKSHWTIVSLWFSNGFRSPFNGDIGDMGIFFKSPLPHKHTGGTLHPTDLPTWRPAMGDEAAGIPGIFGDSIYPNNICKSHVYRIHIYIYIYVYTCHLSVSLSLCIYIYIHTDMCISLHILYMYRHCWLQLLKNPMI